MDHSLEQETLDADDEVLLLTSGDESQETQKYTGVDPAGTESDSDEEEARPQIMKPQRSIAMSLPVDETADEEEEETASREDGEETEGEEEKEMDEKTADEEELEGDKEIADEKKPEDDKEIANEEEPEDGEEIADEEEPEDGEETEDEDAEEIAPPPTLQRCDRSFARSDFCVEPQPVDQTETGIVPQTPRGPISAKQLATPSVARAEVSEPLAARSVSVCLLGFSLENEEEEEIEEQAPSSPVLKYKHEDEQLSQGWIQTKQRNLTDSSMRVSGIVMAADNETRLAVVDEGSAEDSSDFESRPMKRARATGKPNNQPYWELQNGALYRYSENKMVVGPFLPTDGEEHALIMMPTKLKQFERRPFANGMYYIKRGKPISFVYDASKKADPATHQRQSKEFYEHATTWHPDNIESAFNSMYKPHK